MLETTRLLLRPSTLADAQNLLILNSDPDVVRYTGDGRLQNLFEAEELIKTKTIPQFNLYRMGRFSTLLKDGTYLGWCGLKYHPETDEVDLGYRFMKKYWGLGYATEAAKACLEYGFSTLKLKKIIAQAMPDNKASIKVIQKLGMTFVGVRREECAQDSYVAYELLADRFKS